MIKKIHYVWLGGASLPPNVVSCINSWKKNCPEWEIIQWNENNFNINSYIWVKEAIQAKKYAFAADFIRLFILKKYGGIYCDTDVQILRPLEQVLDASYVSGIENHAIGTNKLYEINENGYDKRGKRFSGFCLQAGFMYSEQNHPFIDYCISELYDNGNKHFIRLEGLTNEFVIDEAMMVLLQKKYGIKYRDTTQYLDDDIKIYDSSFFATRKSKCHESYVIHWFDQSWKNDMGFIFFVKKWIKKHLYFLYRKI